MFAPDTARAAALLLAIAVGCGGADSLGLPGFSGGDDGDTGVQGGDGGEDGPSRPGNTFLPQTEGGPGSDGSGDAAGDKGGAGDTGGQGGSPSAAEEFAEARCAALLSCDCPVVPFEDVAACEASMHNQFEGVISFFADGTFDSECFDEIVAYYDAADCETPLEVAAQSLAPACDLYFGDAAVDEACVLKKDTAIHGHTCGEGLRCVNTIEGRLCRPDGDVSHLLEPGEPCVSADGVIGPCVGGYFCDTVSSENCVVRRPAGQPCVSNSWCESGLWCDKFTDPDLPVCATKLAVGARCPTTAACAPPICTDDGCERPLCAGAVCQRGVPQACLSEDL